MTNILWGAVLCFCGITLSPSKPFSTTWRFVDPGWSTNQSYTEIHLVSKTEGMIPFYWRSISYSLLDSMVQVRLQQDSLLAKLEQGVSKKEGRRVKINLDSIDITHSVTQKVKIASCEYKLEVFTVMASKLNRKEVMRNYDYYKMYYLKGIGFVGAVFKKEVQLSPEWVRYELEDIADNKGHSIINKKELKAIVTKVMAE